MEVFAVIIAGFFIFFIIPVICGQYAASIGRPFWKWFIIACFLSFITLFILLALPEKNDTTEQDVDDLNDTEQ